MKPSKDAVPDVRASAAFILGALRGGVSKPDLADACDWLERSLTADPLIQAQIGTLVPGTLVILKPAEKIEPQRAQAFVKDLTRAMGGKFQGAVFTDPGMSIENLDDERLDQLRLVRMPKNVRDLWRSLLVAVGKIAVDGPSHQRDIELDAASHKFVRALIEDAQEILREQQGG